MRSWQPSGSDRRKPQVSLARNVPRWSQPSWLSQTICHRNDAVWEIKGLRTTWHLNFKKSWTKSKEYFQELVRKKSWTNKSSVSYKMFLMIRKSCMSWVVRGLKERCHHQRKWLMEKHHTEELLYLKENPKESWLKTNGKNGNFWPREDSYVAWFQAQWI